MQNPPILLCAPLLLAAALWWGQSPQAPEAVRERNWAEILGPPSGGWPNPRPAVLWYQDLDEAKTVAAREGRPLFVVMRCLPCKQCAEFDAEVLEGGPRLEPLLRQFVTVRLTSVQSVDLRQFPMQGMQDLDLSWWGWFLSPEGSIYGVFGGKDEKGDRSRISVDALAATLRRVLDHHNDPRRADWNIDTKAARGAKPVTPFDLPGFPSWARRFDNTQPIDCLHCHQVAEILRQPALDAKTFDKDKDLQIWPYPENIGLELVRDDGLLVGRVRPGSPAAKAGIKDGDRIAAAGARKLFSQADLRAVLQRLDPAGDKLHVHWLRDERVMQATLELRAEWKRVLIDWRQSVADGNIGAHPGFAWPNPLKDEEKRNLGIPLSQMAVRPYYGKETSWVARRSGLGTADVILAVNGKSPNITGREFLVWFRRNFEPGDEVTLRVIDPRRKEREITYRVTARGR